jgi:hypothetical protein
MPPCGRPEKLLLPKSLEPHCLVFPFLLDYLLIHMNGKPNRLGSLLVALMRCRLSRRLIQEEIFAHLFEITDKT